jgi:hypothetical protein
VAVLVEGEVADGEQAVAGPDGGPPSAHEPAQPRHDLLEAERLGDVVVAAGSDAGDAVLDGVLRGEEQHGHVGVGAAHPAQHLEAVDVREHDVEEHDVRRELARGADPGGARTGRADLPAVVAQRHRQQILQHRLVVDDERAQRAAVGTGEAVGGGAGRRGPARRRCARRHAPHSWRAP